VLGYEPNYSVEDIVDDLYEHVDQYGDMEQDIYYNIRMFKKMEQAALV
jgi:hypothetical protein